MDNHGLQMPDGVQVEEESETTGQFVIEPLERGYGVTVGNALRRVLLSSLRGLAVTAVKIDGVQHEFSTIEGVTEDVSDIILNLKEVRFKADEMREGHLHLNLEGPDNWTAEDIDEATSDFEVLNPTQHVVAVPSTIPASASTLTTSWPSSRMTSVARSTASCTESSVSSVATSG